MNMAGDADADAEKMTPYQRLIALLSRIEDGAVLRTAFFALLIGTAGVLYADYRELNEGQALSRELVPQPILPPATTPAEGGQQRPAITTSLELLDAPLDIVLRAGGELALTGTIDYGAATRFAGEIAARGEYVKVVVLDSPGGSVDDALAMGRLIHERGLATKVASGSLCASSCPVVFASGAERIAGRDAAIGVHQIYAAALTGGESLDALGAAGLAMADAQTVTADITRHLSLTGVDPALWLHALETAPQQLYYFTPEEMETLLLVTHWVAD
jgi:hypothetical protein